MNKLTHPPPKETSFSMAIIFQAFERLMIDTLHKCLCPPPSMYYRFKVKSLKHKKKYFLPIMPVTIIKRPSVYHAKSL